MSTGTVCEECHVALPECAHFEIHRLHADPIFARARTLGWEDSFYVDPEDLTVVVECEGRTVCKADSKEAAEMIRDALEFYWEHKSL